MSAAEDKQREQIEKLLGLKVPTRFIFSNKQIDWINKERKELQEMIDAKPTSGLFRLVARQEAINVMVEIHNAELKKD